MADQMPAQCEINSLHTDVCIRIQSHTLCTPTRLRKGNSTPRRTPSSPVEGWRADPRAAGPAPCRSASATQAARTGGDGTHARSLCYSTPPARSGQVQIGRFEHSPLFLYPYSSSPGLAFASQCPKLRVPDHVETSSMADISTPPDAGVFSCGGQIPTVEPRQPCRLSIRHSFSQVPPVPTFGILRITVFAVGPLLLSENKSSSHWSLSLRAPTWTSTP